MGCYTSCAGVKVKKKHIGIHGSKARKKPKIHKQKDIVGGVSERGVEYKLGGSGSSEIHV